MERHGHLDLDPRVRQRLLAASAATLDRLLQPIRTPASRKLRRRRNQSPGALPQQNRYPTQVVDSNQSLPTFGCTGSPGESSHDIRDTLVTAVGKTRCKASANLFRAFDIPVLRLIDTQCGSPKGHYVNPPTRGFSRMPKERRARSLTVSAVSLTFRVGTARRQRMPRTESAQDGRTDRAAPTRIRDGERASLTPTAATPPSPTPSATMRCRRPICWKQLPDQDQKG